MCFVTDCQKGSLLGSKELRTNVLELQCVMLANHDQNIQSRFRLLKVCFCVKLESSYCRIYCAILFGSIDRNSGRMFFCRIFQLNPSSYDVQGFMFFLKYKRKNLATFYSSCLCCMYESRAIQRCLPSYILRVIKIKIDVESLVIVSVIAQRA